jgi:predicted transposase/invertase (TIGR01784 family)
MKFLDVKTDYAFKRVFGSVESVPLLISFLNAILDYTGDDAIVELTILDPYLVPKLQGMKDTYVDVRAKLKNGSSIIIEMQVLNVKGFEQRVLYNAAKEFSNQLQTGQAYKLLNPVIAITFTDFKMFDDIAHYQSNFVMQEKTQFIQYSDDLELVFVELPKFNKTENELTDIKDKWIYFVKNAGKLDYIPTALQEPCIEEALSMANEAGLSKEDLELQHRRHDFILLQQGSLELAEEKGEARGIERGIELGKQEGIELGEHTKALAIAQNLLDVLDDATIAAKTGLTIEQVKALRNL